MSLVRNWQIERSMSYWYPESRPRRQFAAVFDINKCIACQTCTLACKTTWTSGKGQEYMLWNNVESKPYGFYPLGWDVKLLEALGTQQWQGATYEGRTIFEAAGAGGEQFGIARVEAIIREMRSDPVCDIVHAVREAVNVYTKHQPADDDRTGVVIRREA